MGRFVIIIIYIYMIIIYIYMIFIYIIISYNIYIMMVLK